MLHGETAMLRQEAAGLARTLAAAWPPTALPAPTTLSTPMVYPAMVSAIGVLRRSRIPRDVGEFHARLSAARALLGAGEATDAAAYQLLSHAVRAVNGVEPALWEIERRIGWPRSAKADKGDADARLEAIETRLATEAPELLTPAYLWLALPA